MAICEITISNLSLKDFIKICSNYTDRRMAGILGLEKKQKKLNNSKLKKNHTEEVFYKFQNSHPKTGNFVYRHSTDRFLIRQKVSQLPY